MKPITKHYIKAKQIQATTIIDIESIVDFYHYYDAHGCKEIFIFETPSKFGVLCNNALIQIETNEYQNIDDYKKAVNNNFSNAKDYYKALELEIDKFEEFDLITKYGITDKSITEEIRTQGYLEGFDKYKKFEEQQHKIPAHKNAFELYNFAKENYHISFDKFFIAHESGFSNALEYEAAIEKGYTNNFDYSKGLSGGFSNFEEYNEAKQCQVDNSSEYLKKKNLEFSFPDLPHDQSLLLLLLSKLEANKKVSVNKLKSLLENELLEYRSPEETFYGWLKLSLNDNNQLSEFLQNNENVGQFGNYDADGEFFEVFKIQNRSVVIDGSNVAHNSVNGITEKPSIKNLLTLIKFLKKNGFQDIKIIADASLRHKLSDLNRLDELQKETKYLVAPAGTTADIYLIQHVKNKHCLLISNDTFKQYKMIDSWVALNLDYYRLTFMITDGEVFMPDLK